MAEPDGYSKAWLKKYKTTGVPHFQSVAHLYCFNKKFSLYLPYIDSFMHRILLLLLFIPAQLRSQIFPKEGSKLNYRIIGFSFPQIKNAEKCRLEIATGNYNTEDSFRKNIISYIDCDSNKIIAEVPSFGGNYTWRVVYKAKKGTKNELHHFSTLTCPNVDTANIRLRIIQSTEKYKDAYVFLDCTEALYDMKGNPVWFFPGIGKTQYSTNTRDIKITRQGTITLIAADQVYEINYNGAVLWKGPNTGEISGDSIEHYHHEFTRLSNGHYMVLGNENVFMKLPFLREDNLHIATDEQIRKDSNNNYYQRMQFGTVIEYDETGKVVWSWKSSDYFEQSDIYSHTLPDGKYSIKDVHENSFYFDENNNNVYVSFRDISRIIKIKYPEGTVIAEYGNKFDSVNEDVNNDLFYGQHSLGISQDGYLYFFNNNDFKQTNNPKLTMMQEPVSETDSLKIIWQYDCSMEGMNDYEQNIFDQHKVNVGRLPTKNKSLKLRLTSGGNIIELPDHAVFASMSGYFGKVFIINPDKEILWSAVPEKKLKDNIWNTTPLYRASIILKREYLEKLIWNTEMKEK